jgi:hypothetical protein
MLKGRLFLLLSLIGHKGANGVANSIAEETNKTTVNEKLSDLIELESTIEEKLDNRFDELISKVDEQGAILTHIHTDIRSVISAM